MNRRTYLKTVTCAAAAQALPAAEAQPIGERRGVVTIGCRSAVWAQELDLMGADLVARLNAAIGEEVVRSLRCVATGA